MKFVGMSVISMVFVSLVSCGAPQSAGSSSETSATTRSSSQPSLDDKKVNCVASGGFLVAQGNSFVCRLPNGQVANLWSL